MYGLEDLRLWIAGGLRWRVEGTNMEVSKKIRELLNRGEEEVGLDVVDAMIEDGLLSCDRDGVGGDVRRNAGGRRVERSKKVSWQDPV